MSRKVLTAIVCGILTFAAPAFATPPESAPAPIDLPKAGVRITLPAGYEWIPEAEARKVLEEDGARGEGLQGIIIPTAKDGNNYFVVCSFDDCGYVSDDDAEKLNANDLLNSYREGAKEQNEVRKDNGMPPIYVGDWAEKPHYDKAKHHVIWGIQVKDEDGASAPVAAVNYNTRILGRRGVLSMNLVTDQDKIELNKTKVATLLNQTTFNKGSAYGDYVKGQDKAAGYGIAGLILGGGAFAAAAKLGLLGGLWKWALGILLVFKKFAVVGIVAIGAIIGKIFGGKKKDEGQV
jgi:uncharacterized membrane-anchored protein